MKIHESAGMIPRPHLALAFAGVEGWFDTPNPTKPLIPHRCLNPGNLRWAPARFPQDGMDAGYVKFRTKEAGFAACENDLYAKMLRGLTLQQTIDIYAPAADGNNPTRYARTVADWLGIKTTDRLKDVIAAEGRVLIPWIKAPEMGPPKPDWGDLGEWMRQAGVVVR